MPYSSAHGRATQKYIKKTYDRIEIKVYKGEKAILQAHAVSQGENLSQFINRAIKEAVERDNKTKQ